MSKAPRARAIRKQAQRTAARERAIQRRIDRKDKSRGKPARKARAMQAGTRKYPVPKFPRQHLRKPGREADLALAPMYEAPDYRGSGKLRDKVALVTGGDSGIGRAVAVLFAREGADLAVAYLNEHDDAAETKRCIEAEGRRCVLVAGDVRKAKFAQKVVARTIEAFGR